MLSLAELEEYEIESIHFCLSSEADIRSRSVLSITTSDLYLRDRKENRCLPAPGGLLDEVLGVGSNSRRGSSCVTCGLSFEHCSGHWGSLELVEPVYNASYLDCLVKMLNSVCFFCGCLYAETRVLERLPMEQRLPAATLVGKSSTACRRCEKPHARIIKVPAKGLLSVIYQDEEGGETQSRLLYAKDAARVCSLISDSSVPLLGLQPGSRPEHMLFSVFPIPPLNIRPTSLSGRDRRESELTLKLRRIVLANEALSRATHPNHSNNNNNSYDYQKQAIDLQQAVNDYILGESKGAVSMTLTDRKQATESKTLRDRFKGKEGRVRGNMMGKRVDFCARTVIGPDPNVRIHEVGVPQSKCATLTYPEAVTPRNIERLYELIRAGPDHYPGANYVIRRDGSRMDLRVCGAGVCLQLGDKVERHVQDEDIVLMNRQPSLHRMSMMGHRVRVLPGDTFRVNPNACPPYNADFDGDEMNLHVLQSEEARAETLELGMVYHNIINPKTCGPIIALIQDAMYGTYLMTCPGVTVSARQLSGILARLDSCGTKGWPDLRSRKRWSGRELFSYALPSGVYMCKSVDEGETVCIVDGQLRSGTLTKTEVNSRNGLIRIIHKEMGCEAASRFLDAAQTIANAWLEGQGASIGLEDMMLDRETTRHAERLREQEEQAFHEFLRQSPTEKEIGAQLERSREKFVNLVRYHAQEHGNHIADTIRAGSKGEYLKLTQMMGCVGTQRVRGKLLQPNENSRRAYCYCSIDPEQRDMNSYGFITSSYVRGLKPGEYALHACAGREGLVDTAIRTSDTGYIQRRLVKALEDITVKWDGTVRRSDGAIIQPSFGGHGLDPVQMEVQSVNMHTWSREQLEASHIWSDSSLLTMSLASHVALRIEEENIRKLWTYVTQHQARLSQWSSSMAAAFHIRRLIWEASQRYPLSSSYPISERGQVATDLTQLMVRLTHHARRLHTTGSLLLHQWLLLENASSKMIVEQHKLSAAAVSWLLERVEYHFQHSAIQPGEAVGMIAAQVLGSDSTQMTLNTFHSIGEENITMGVPRLKEIVDITPTKEPRTTLKLVQSAEPERLRDSLAAFVSLTAHVSLSTLLLQIQLLSMNEPSVRAELSIQRLHLVLEPDEFREQLSDQVLRLKCDPHIVSAQLPMGVLVRRLEHVLHHNERYIIMAADDNEEKHRGVIHIRYLQSRTAAGRVRRGKQTTKRLQQALELFSNPKTLLLPLSLSRNHSSHGDEPRVLIVSADAHAQPERLVLPSRCLQDCLLLLKHTDPLRSYCNDFREVSAVLGIEAGREVLRREALKVFQFGGTDVLPAFINLIVDVMTYCGQLFGVTRTGVLAHQAVGPLMQCSFEVTTNVLRDAALLGQTDHILGVSECVMTGRPTRVGTYSDLELLSISSCPDPHGQDLDDDEEEEEELTHVEHDEFGFTRAPSPCYQLDWNGRLVEYS